MALHRGAAGCPAPVAVRHTCRSHCRARPASRNGRGASRRPPLAGGTLATCEAMGGGTGAAQSAAADHPPGAPLLLPVAAAVFWDLDNMTVHHLAHLPLVGRRLMAAVHQHVLPASHQTLEAPPSCQLTAYANERTLARFKHGGCSDGSGAEAAARALGLVGGRLVAVKTRRNAADSALRSDVHAWAILHGPASAIACVSGDTGFTGVLRYAATTCGCTVAAVTDPLRTLRRLPWAPPPDYGRFPLPAAAGCCLVWDPSWVPVSEEEAAEEAALVAQWVAAGKVPDAPLPCRGGVSAVWRAPASEA